MKAANALFSSLGTTIFTVMSRLAQEHGAINLGQGFPEGLEPPDVIEAARAALTAGPHQYPPMMGEPVLRQAVAAHEARFYGLDIDWEREVLVTSGATEALADALFGLIEPGDEVVLLEPLYDSYLPIVRRAGGIPRLVRLEPPHWDLPREALARAFGPRTKLMILNSPMNPCGKVFSPEELVFLADLLERHDAYALCDEVYEHLVFDGRPHVPLMTVPGMRERCVRIGSAGKTFSLTNWKVGLIVAAPALLEPIAKAHQYLTFTTPIPLQRAVAYGLGKDDAYFDGLKADMQARRDRLARGLEALGVGVLACAGTYFLSADFRPLGVDRPDAELCRWLTTEAKVTLVPVSAFYAQDTSDSPPPAHLVRFCFAKRDADLDEALARLGRFFNKATQP
ncbi:aminotransferase [Pararhodospirillum photometricum]|nr:aminotransferase [Pararhodospirillum photometricum]